MLRTDIDSLTIVTKSGYFTKAYALNRFLAYLLYETLKRLGLKRFEILSGEVTSFAQFAGGNRGAVLEIQELATSTPITRNCELAIIRGGLERATAPTQLLGLTGIDTGRAELGRIPPSIRPVGIPRL